MKITILCSDPSHPVLSYVRRWMDARSTDHQVSLVHKRLELEGGDLLLLVSCSELIGAADRERYRRSLVIHASELPQGRGWSPHVWQIINGASELTVTLLEAEDRVDSGRIWHQVRVPVPKHALWDEINEILFAAEITLMDFAVDQFDSVLPREQDAGAEVSYYPRRFPSDSLLDVNGSIAAQFDLIRVCDPMRFPAHFMLHGHTYRLTVEKIDE